MASSPAAASVLTSIINQGEIVIGWEEQMGGKRDLERDGFA